MHSRLASVNWHNLLCQKSNWQSEPNDIFVPFGRCQTYGQFAYKVALIDRLAFCPHSVLNSILYSGQTCDPNNLGGNKVCRKLEKAAMLKCSIV